MYEPGTGTAAPLMTDFEIDGTTLVKYHGQSTAPTIPYGVRIIGEGAFASQMITSVSLPDSVEVIGAKAFYLCMRLNHVHMSSSLTRIEANAFEHCRSLLTLSLPDGLRFIGERAFASSGLSGFVEIPASVEHLGHEAFCYCPWLTRAVFHGTPRDLGKSIFAQCALFLQAYGADEIMKRLNRQSESTGTAPSDPGDKTGG